MGSIGDNGSGGLHAYRTSKAAVNMVFKGMSCDLKPKGIAVAIVNPNMVMTDFGPGREQMEKMGAITVELSVAGILQICDELSIDNTGGFMHVAKDGTVKPFPG